MVDLPTVEMRGEAFRHRGSRDCLALEAYVRIGAAMQWRICMEPEHRMTSLPILVEPATPDDYAQVGACVWALMIELLPDRPDELDRAAIERDAVRLLSADHRIHAFVARANGSVIGAMTLNECAAIYAGGTFGEISELYVAPDFRSTSVGSRLLQAARDFAAGCGWTMLEVGAPHLPDWQRTVDFYLANGYQVVGPRLEINIASTNGEVG